MEALLERYTVQKYEDSRFYALYDRDALICVTVYRKGAEAVRRLLIGFELLLMKAEGTIKEVCHDERRGEEADRCARVLPMELRRAVHG
jgi:hypothetical protein